MTRIGYHKSRILKVELTVDGVRDLTLGCRMMCKVAPPIETQMLPKYLINRASQRSHGREDLCPQWVQFDGISLGEFGPD